MEADSRKKIIPRIHAGYMISEILMQKEDYKGQWWVVWYHPETFASAGMESFKIFDEASKWNEENPPTRVEEEIFTRSTIIFAGH